MLSEIAEAQDSVTEATDRTTDALKREEAMRRALEDLAKEAAEAKAKRQADLEAGLNHELDLLANQHAAEQRAAEFRAAEEERIRGLRARGTADAIDGIADVAEAHKEAGRAAFAVYKATALSQIVFSTVTGVQKAIAEFAALPPVAAALSASIIASGVAQAAKVAAEQPKFHLGGVVPGAAGSEVTARVQPGEGFLTAKGVATVGGAAGVAAINQGSMASGPAVTLFQYESRIGGRWLRDEVRGRTALGSALTTAPTALPGRRARS